MKITQENCPRTYAVMYYDENAKQVVPASLCAKLELRLAWYKQKLEDMQNNVSHDDRAPAYL